MSRQQDNPLFFDTLFHRKRKKGKWDVVEAPQLEAPVADTHAHLQLLPHPALALARSAAQGVNFICTITDVYEDGDTTFKELSSWILEAKDLIHRLLTPCWEAPLPSVPQVRIASGCHPHNAKHYTDSLEEALRSRLADPRVCALGEIGLDYHYDLSPREDQLMAFRRQLRLAKECMLPVILHVREAHEEAYEILEKEGFPDWGVVLHCFNRDFSTLEPWLKRGCYISFGGPITFKKSDDTREAATHVPLERLLTETDAPYMTPEPLRGTICGPEYVVFTAECLARVRQCASGNERRALLQQLHTNALNILDRQPSVWQKREKAQAYREVLS